jgi:hypothetical protein
MFASLSEFSRHAGWGIRYMDLCDGESNNTMRTMWVWLNKVITELYILVNTSYL